MGFLLNNNENLVLETKCTLVFSRTFLNKVSKIRTGGSVSFKICRGQTDLVIATHSISIDFKLFFFFKPQL